MALSSGEMRRRMAAATSWALPPPPTAPQLMTLGDHQQSTPSLLPSLSSSCPFLQRLEGEGALAGVKHQCRGGCGSKWQRKRQKGWVISQVAKEEAGGLQTRHQDLAGHGAQEGGLGEGSGWDVEVGAFLHPSAPLSL